MDTTPLSNNENDFMRQGLAEGLRIDGRKLTGARELKIDFELEPGTVKVSLGKTKVLCSVSAELGMPSEYRPNEGRISFSCHFSNYMEFEKQEIDRILNIIESGINESQCIDFESLCVLSGEKVWNLVVDICIIENDGNIVDCCNIAVICSLKHHRRPDVTVVGSQVTVHSMIDRHPISLTINNLPICVTLGHVNLPQTMKDNENNNGKKKHFQTIVDPCLKEEKLLNGKTIYCMTKHKQLCAIDKIGGICYESNHFISFIYDYVINIVTLWDNEIENKFIQAKLDDPRKRKELLNAKIIDPINAFKPFEIKKDDAIDENKSDPSYDGKNDNNGNNDNDNDMWDSWMLQEAKKFQIIQTNLNQLNHQQNSENRVNADKSLLKSEFD